MTMVNAGRHDQRPHRQGVGADRGDDQRLDPGTTIGPPALSE